MLAGFKALLRRAKWSSVDRVIVAGSFGDRLRVESATRLGLLPPVEAGCVTFVGNAAGEGACRCLLDAQQRQEATRISRAVEHADLVADDRFAADFVAALTFP